MTDHLNWLHQPLCQIAASPSRWQGLLAEGKALLGKPVIDAQDTYTAVKNLIEHMDKMQNDRKDKGKPLHKIGKTISINLNSRMQQSHMALTGALPLGTATGALSRGG